jgi:hypothetical protein
MSYLQFICAAPSHTRDTGQRQGDLAAPRQTGKKFEQFVYQEKNEKKDR